jgi:phage recombination protein Bet
MEGLNMAQSRPVQTRQAPRQQQQAPQPPPQNQAVAVYRPRLPMPAEAQRAGITAERWQQFVDVVWPNAKTAAGIMLAVDYCKARNLDPMKRPVHVVPIYSSVLEKQVDSVWPGINELRTTAMRTKDYAGMDDPALGPMMNANLDNVTVEYPQWAQVTVYRLDRTGAKRAIVGPKVYWRETYATAKRDTIAPNAMWKKRPIGQLVKCAEAAALRAGFPEELGNTYTSEEMWGQVIDHVPTADGAVPPRPVRQQYSAGSIEHVASPPPPPAPPPEPVFDVVDAEGEIAEYALSYVGDALVKVMEDAARRPDKAEARRALNTVASNNQETIVSLRTRDPATADRFVRRYRELTAELDPFGLPATDQGRAANQPSAGETVAPTTTAGAAAGTSPPPAAASGSPAGSRPAFPVLQRGPAGADWVGWMDAMLEEIRRAPSRARLSAINGEIGRYRTDCPPNLLQSLDEALSDRSGQV